MFEGSTRITVNESGCWEWQGSLNTHGYGHLLIGRGHNYTAHRLIYRLLVGTLNKHSVVRHSCDNRKCINPDHLLLGTAQDNVNDRVARVALPREPRTAVKEIRASKERDSVLARKYSVALPTIRLVRDGITWREDGEASNCGDVSKQRGL